MILGSWLHLIWSITRWPHSKSNAHLNVISLSFTIFPQVTCQSIQAPWRNIMPTPRRSTTGFYVDSTSKLLMEAFLVLRPNFAQTVTKTLGWLWLLEAWMMRLSASRVVQQTTRFHLTLTKCSVILTLTVQSSHVLSIRVGTVKEVRIHLRIWRYQ